MIKLFFNFRHVVRAWWRRCVLVAPVLLWRRERKSESPRQGSYLFQKLEIELVLKVNINIHDAVFWMSDGFFFHRVLGSLSRASGGETGIWGSVGGWCSSAQPSVLPLCLCYCCGWVERVFTLPYNILLLKRQDLKRFRFKCSRIVW